MAIVQELAPVVMIFEPLSEPVTNLRCASQTTASSMGQDSRRYFSPLNRMLINHRNARFIPCISTLRLSLSYVLPRAQIA